MSDEPEQLGEPQPTLTPLGVEGVPGVPHGRTAQRLTWPHLPGSVRALVEQRLGSPVTQARSSGAGFTPGFASVLTGADGRRLFVKAASRKAQRAFADAYLTEAGIQRRLPAGVPAPRLRWVHEDDAWVVLGFDAVEGRPPRRPWRARGLEACLDTLEEAAVALSPPPAGLSLRPLTEDLPLLTTAWAELRRTAPLWPHREQAAALAERYPEIPDRTAVVHADARDDNFVLDRGGRAWLCDWNWPALGPAWMDVVDLLVSAHADGLDADAVLARRELTRQVDPEHVDMVLAQLVGFMLVSASKPSPPTSPFLRVHGRWYAEAAWAWLAGRRGWS